MMKMVNIPEREKPPVFSGMSVNNSDRVPMHPDDFAGLMSWITAKRSHETGHENTCPEIPVYFGLIG